MAQDYFVYIMSNVSRTLYIGMTNNLERRVLEHRAKSHSGFTQRYNVTMLVYMEHFNNPASAIEREKVLKGWKRVRKLALITSQNPDWLDLAAGWFDS
jgi:putative endonuclease